MQCSMKQYWIQRPAVCVSTEQVINQRCGLVTNLTSPRGSIGLAIMEFLKEKKIDFGRKYCLENIKKGTISEI